MTQSDTQMADVPAPGRDTSGTAVPGPTGKHRLVYADYVASGRADEIVEKVISRHILPYYANTHSESSFCGEHTTRMHEQARRIIHRLARARHDDVVVFAGSGMTGALAVLMYELQLGPGQALNEEVLPLVLVGPYEHHSNLLPWRESGAEVVAIDEASEGGPDLRHLDRLLKQSSGKRRIIGSFGAASNVTGILTDTRPVTRLLHEAGALAIWDYAAAAPYVEIEIDKGPRCEQPDAIVFSPHKFPGGPGASGVLIADPAIFRSRVPVRPGGGTVSFVSPWAHDYFDDPMTRSEGGTPNIPGDIRAALVMMRKAETSASARQARLTELTRAPLKLWRRNPAIKLLGNLDAPRLPTFSFCVLRKDGTMFDHELFVRMLSDLYGIQARSGCACAGPYGHHLFGIDRAASNSIRHSVAQGDLSTRPGFARLSFCPDMSDNTVSYIVNSVDNLAREAEAEAARHGQYRSDEYRFSKELHGSDPSLWDYFHDIAR